MTTGLLPWQDYIVINPSTHPAGPPFSLQKLDKFPPGVSFSNAVSALGMPGLTAYFGLLGTHPQTWISQTRHTAFLPVWLALVHRHL
jgi:NADPH-dependent curcumin reductase CurA